LLLPEVALTAVAISEISGAYQRSQTSTEYLDICAEVVKIFKVVGVRLNM
jgi:hypothetical protein